MRKRPIVVLSLFNGMSCGQLALEKAGFIIKEYYSSEINKPSIKVTQKNYPDTIQIGDVTKVKYKRGFLYYEDVNSIMKKVFVGKIDLVIAGSPCQDFSRANTKGEGIKGKKSGLFWEFERILREVQPTYFLLENVKMSEHDKSIIDNTLGINGIMINSNLVSAQNRERYYWTNIPDISQPKNMGIFFKDIIFDDSYRIIEKESILKIIKETSKITINGYYQYANKNGKNHKSQQNRLFPKDGKINTLTTTSGGIKIIIDHETGKYRMLHPIEAERLQNVPVNYTLVDGVSKSDRFAMLGNGWTIDIISHIFNGMTFNKPSTNIKLKKIFKTESFWD